MMNPAPVPKEWRQKVVFFREGDRVVVVEGREGVKGRIGTIRIVDRESETCFVEGVNRVSFIERLSSSYQLASSGKGTRASKHR